MQKWEYLVRHIGLAYDTDEEAETLLDARGREGWELVTVIYAHEYDKIIFYFKRPLYN